MTSNRDRTFLWNYFVDYCTEMGLDLSAPGMEDEFDRFCDNHTADD